MGRVEERLGERLRGRDIPPDLRRLVELELDGVLAGADSVQPFAELHVLEPGELHGLEDPRYRGTANAEQLANGRAMDEVLGHMAVVMDGFNGDLFGYWVHPDEPPTAQPAIVKLDTEGVFDTLDGATLVEAMVFDWLGYDSDEPYFERITAFCDRYAIPLAARSREALRRPVTTVDPAQLHDLLYRRYAPFTRRPEWTEHPALVGLPVADPGLRALWDQLGYADPAATVARLDDGTGEVRLTPDTTPVDLVLYQDTDGSWWLFSVKYHRPTPERPVEVALPLGFSLTESREATRARFGPPQSTAQLVPADRWHLGPVVAYAMFDDDGLPRYVEFWPADVTRRS